MNLPPQNVINNPIANLNQQPTNLYGHQVPYPPISQWGNNNMYNTYQLPLQLSQYYNVFPEVPSTRTSWTFPNGCVTSNIVRFTGTPMPTYPNTSPAQLDQYKGSNTVPVKRKSLNGENEIHPNKLFITEEKMAARMSGMHISNEFISHNSNEFSGPVNANQIDEELPDCNTKESAQPQLVVCDELKNLHKDMNTLIPEPLIPFEKHTTALVLWRPPMSYLNVVKVPPEEEEYPTRSSVIITDITDRPDLDNNNISTVDLNTLINPPTEYSQDLMEMDS